MEKRLKIYISIIIFLLIFDIVLWSNLYLVVYRNAYNVISCSAVYYEPSKEPDDITVKQAIEIVNEHFNINYTLKFEDMQENGLLGKATFIFNIVRIDNDISGWEVLYVLTHELCHLKYYTINETFTEYMAFVELYESDNEIMHNRGEWMAREQVYYRKKLNTEYDCAWYIRQYLNI